MKTDKTAAEKNTLRGRAEKIIGLKAAYTAIPVLLCTGFSDAMTDEKIKSLGIKDVLMKPVLTKDLAKKDTGNFGSIVLPLFLISNMMALKGKNSHEKNPGYR